ncbi:hypothetical protein MKW94_017413 [Papaver nudicaule]|uniref:non-specific serine/threonine protein kinase n=1 Tax=Papaver nudicaule TaxID=74823 RepID=A0AA41VTQ0_PAPNU|nr:hypothetical protein [Papaver nudicaule]
MDDTRLLEEQLLKKIQELEFRDANLREEMAKLTRCGASSGIGTVDFGIKIDCSNQSPLNSVQRPARPTSSCREIGGDHDKTMPTWKAGSASSKDKERSILDCLNPRGNNLSFTDKQSYNILQSMGQAIHIVDDKGLIIYWNRAAEDLYGYSASEAIGHYIVHLIAEEHVYEAGKEILHRSFMGESWTGMFPVINKQGRRFRVIVTNSPLYDDCGTLIGFISVTCDSKPFRETLTTFTSIRNPCTEDAYPSSSQPSKSGALATEQKSFQVKIASKLFDLLLRLTKSVRWITRTRAEARKNKIQGGNRPYGNRKSLLETAVYDPREYAKEKMYQEKLFGDFSDEDTSKMRGCKMTTSGVTGIFLPWKGGGRDMSMRRTTTHGIYPSLNHELKDDFDHQKSPALPKKVVEGYLFSSKACSSVVTSGSSSSSSKSTPRRTISEADSMSYDISWGDLILGEQIGRGSCATVYHGLWCGSDVAVKVFSNIEYSDDLLRTFKQEVLLMKRLRHPNVLLFMGAVTSPQHLCIVTEFLPRGSLFNLLRRKPPALGWKRRVLMALDIARSMNYLHCYNPPIVHRDLKSSNLLVDNNWNLKVGDFGLSRLKHATFLTTKNANGTPQWMAPEVIRNEPADEKSDVYSFGVVLWELVTGRIPWDDQIPVQVIGAVGFMDQRVEIPEDTDPQWASLINTCLHSDSKCRPTFGELLERLNAMRRSYFAKCTK